MTIVHEFVTSYEKKKDLLNFIKTPEFFYKIKEDINCDGCKFIPDISSNLFSNKYIKWPQKIVFEDSFDIFGFSLPTMDIEQEYNLKYDKLSCKILASPPSMSPIELNVNIDILQENVEDKVTLRLSCNEPEDIYLPEIIINLILGKLDSSLKKVFG